MKVERLGVELATSLLRVRRRNYCTITNSSFVRNATVNSFVKIIRNNGSSQGFCLPCKALKLSLRPDLAFGRRVSPLSSVTTLLLSVQSLQHPQQRASSLPFFYFPSVIILASAHLRRFAPSSAAGSSSEPVCCVLCVC